MKFIFNVACLFIAVYGIANATNNSSLSEVIVKVPGGIPISVNKASGIISAQAFLYEPLNCSIYSLPNTEPIFQSPFYEAMCMKYLGNGYIPYKIHYKSCTKETKDYSVIPYDLYCKKGLLEI